ncbi:MAG: biopolymer transporter ExbD [Verrucomicrobiota bacterium]
MARRKRTETPVSFQITPMIDMTFLLLVFFMITSTLTEQKVNLDIRLPEATAAILPDDPSRRDVINIDDQGNYYLADDVVSKEELKAYLKKRYGVNTPYMVYLRADKNTPASKTSEFMEIATESGVDRVVFGVLND